MKFILNGGSKVFEKWNIPGVPKKLEFLNLRNGPEKIERFLSVIYQIKYQGLPFYFLSFMKLFDEWWRCSRF